MRERTQNLAESTLSSGVDASTTTIPVTSVASFSTSPQFRVLVDDEIMLVTAISGSNFTVTRGAEGTTATTHASAAVITQVVTQQGLQRYMRDWNRPLFDVQTPMQLLDSSNNTLTASSFTQINFTNASATDESSGPILLSHNTQGAVNDVAMLVRSAPTAPWTLTCAFVPCLLNNNGSFIGVGPVVRDSSTGEFYFHQLRCEDPNAGGGRWATRAFVQKYTNPTTTFGFLTTQANIVAPMHPIWYQIEDNNTNLLFRISGDGKNYIELGSEARTAYLTPDQIGFGVNNFNNGTTKALATLVAWEEA